MFPAFETMGTMEVTLYTDALVIRGQVRTRQRRVSDLLNAADHPFLLLEQATAEELDGSGRPISAEYAQINLDSVLFAVAEVPVESSPELRARKSQETAFIAIPPFRMLGTIHLVPSENGLRGALLELDARFVPVTGVTYWSDHLGISPREALMVAVNHKRTQILTHHEPSETDPSAAEAPGPPDAPDAPGEAS